MEDNPKLIDKSYLIRPYVINRGLYNCSQCGQYICEKLTKRLVVLENIKQRVGAEIPVEDRACFIRPYDIKKRLDTLMKT
jgi:hypothetical protein